MTQLKEYAVCLVIGNSGLNGAQLVDIKHRLKFTAGLMPKEGKITLRVLGFTRDSPKFALGSLAYMDKVTLDYLVEPQNRKPIDGGLIAALQSYDEVWCCTGLGQDTALSRTRVAQIYHKGLADPMTAPHYKLIPEWVAVPETKQRRKVKKGKQNEKAT